jgi:hypothetical protein
VCSLLSGLKLEPQDLETNRKENNMGDEMTQKPLDAAAGADNETTDGAATETTDLDRRRFFGGLATVLGAAAVIGLSGEKDPTQAKEIKSKILSRIQQQLKQEKGEEGMIYDKSSHSRYSKSRPDPDPWPIDPIIVAE